MTAAQWRRAAWVAALVALLAYLEIIALHLGAVAGGSDSSGYMNQARLVAQGSVHAQVRALPDLPQKDVYPYVYIPLGFMPATDGNGMVPTYPLGLSLFIVAFKFLVGWRHAADIVMLLHACAGILATYGLARVLGLSPPWSVLCAAATALSPLYVFMSQQAMSDIPSLAWTTGAVLAALRSRDKASWAVLAGLALSVDVLLRPSNLLAVIPILVALGWSPLRWVLFLSAGIPGAIIYAAHNTAAYGAWWLTGYGDNSNLFGRALLNGTLVHYIHWLPLLFTPLILLALGLPFIPPGKYRAGLLLSSWSFVFVAFYSVYEYTQETWWYLRFLLPAVPALVVGAALVLRMLLDRQGMVRGLSRSPVAFVAAMGLFAASSVWWTLDLGALRGGEEELRYGVLTDWMRTNLPKDSLCFAMQTSGSVYFYTHFTIMRWDMIDKASLPKIKTVVSIPGRPVYAILFPFEVARMQELEAGLGGHWVPVEKIDDVTIYQRLAGTAGT